MGKGVRQDRAGPRTGGVAWPDDDNGNIEKRFRLFSRLHRTILYAFARLFRRSFFGAGLRWFSARITPSVTVGS
jgi:hypothetical protein